MLEEIIKTDTLFSLSFWIVLLKGWLALQLVINFEKSLRQKQGWKKEEKQTDCEIIKIFLGEENRFETEEDEQKWIRKKLQKATPEQKETVMQYLKSL